MSDLEERCRREIVELHQFFEDWFNGALPDEDAAYARFADVLAESFVIVGPEGIPGERAPLLEGLRKAHGRSKQGGTSRIWIEDIVLHHAEGDLAFLRYIEWQNLAGKLRGRQSSVLFREREGMPNGLEWLHVHETWVPSSVRPKNAP